MPTRTHRVAGRFKLIRLERRDRRCANRILAILVEELAGFGFRRRLVTPEMKPVDAPHCQTAFDEIKETLYHSRMGTLLSGRTLAKC